jgi:N4-gp56 family major capsid protein
VALPTAASVVSSGLAHYPTVFYDRKAVAFLRSNLKLYECLEQKAMPDKSGVAMQIFGYTKLAANTTAATEGTPQASGVALTSATGTITLSQYIDYVSYSDKVILTGISPVMEEGAELLGERGALSVETVINVAVDAVAAADATSRIDVAHASFMTAAVSRKAAAQLRSVDAKPKSNGLYKGVINSLISFDLTNDTAAGGFQDAWRYVDPKALQNGPDAASQRIAVIGGIEWFESNSLPTVANFASTGVNGYRGYVFGKDAFFCASLGKTQLGQKNFSVETKQFNGTNSLDPAGTIRAASVYNFFFGMAKRPQSVNTFRRITAESSIG